jgi:putative glycosyltransferase (TIGR04372 family)
MRLYINVNERTARFPEIQRRYRGRPPLLELTAEDVQRGDAAMRELGVPEGAWFVCFHCREFGFDRDDWHSYRNTNIQNFVPAMQAVVDAGGCAIRMGDPTMTPLEPAPGMIDYAHSSARRDWMDIYLLASCRFFVGTTSGLWGPANVFGRPCAIANQTPASRVLPYGAGDIGIPMLYWSEREQRCLSFPEVMRSPASNWSGSSQFRDAGLKMVENDAVDIEALAREMMDTVDGRVEYSNEDEALQATFIGLMHEGHYSYGADARVGRDFLRRHRELLSEPAGQEASAASLSSPDSTAARSSASRAGESTATRNPDSGSA